MWINEQSLKQARKTKVHGIISKQYKKDEKHPMTGKPLYIRLSCYPFRYLCIFFNTAFYIVAAYGLSKLTSFNLCVAYLMFFALFDYYTCVVNVYTEKDVRLGIAGSTESLWEYYNMSIYYLFMRYWKSITVWFPLLLAIVLSVATYMTRETPHQFMLLYASIACVVLVVSINNFKYEVRT